MKILILCPYTSGICGVWERAKNEALIYKKQGEEVYIFSSNAVKGSNEIAPAEDKLDETISIKRYSYKKLGGESFMTWDRQWIKDAVALAPDIIMAHNYRHPHTLGALEVAKLLKERGKMSVQVYLVTHAPFVEDNRTRSFIAACAVNIYDKVIGPRTINKFDKIMAISKWELPYLKKMGADEKKITVVPNPIAQEFHALPKSKMREDVLFLGRVSPVKSIETLIKAAHLCPDIHFNIVGPVEPEYGIKLKALIAELKVTNVEFKEPVYDIIEKIKLIDSHKVFVLPSIREAMPTVLLEAKARDKIIIASNNEGAREVLEGYSQGYLFEIENCEQLAEMIKKVMKNGEKET